MSYYLKYINIQFVPSDTDKSCPKPPKFSFFFPHHTSHIIHNEITNLGPWNLRAEEQNVEGSNQQFVQYKKLFHSLYEIKVN